MTEDERKNAEVWIKENMPELFVIRQLLQERKNCPPASESEYVRRLEDDIIRMERERGRPN